LKRVQNILESSDLPKAGAPTIFVEVIKIISVWYFNLSLVIFGEGFSCNSNWKGSTKNGTIFCLRLLKFKAILREAVLKKKSEKLG
jgi:hypothetical protein